MGEYKITKAKISEFACVLQAEEKSSSTVEKYCRDVSRFAGFVDGEYFTKETVIAYKESLISDGYAIRSINSMLASLNKFFVFLECLDCKVKPCRIQRQIFCAHDKELKKTEYVRLVDEAGNRGKERLALVMQTLCATGIRISELKYITVEAARSGELTVALKGKTRTVFIVRDLQKKLLDYAQKQKIESGRVFITRTGKPVSRTNLWKEMKELCKVANVDSRKVFPHNFRHLFARTFYGQEKNIALLADILGHSSIDTTRIYIMSTGEEHRKKIERMGMIR